MEYLTTQNSTEGQRQAFHYNCYGFKALIV